MIMGVLPELPSGTVTFLFTDVEGSTKLLHELGAKVYARALAEHRQVIRGACARHDGVEVDTQGDALFIAFATAPAAVAAAGSGRRVVAPPARPLLVAPGAADDGAENVPAHHPQRRRSRANSSTIR